MSGFSAAHADRPYSGEANFFVVAADRDRAERIVEVVAGRAGLTVARAKDESWRLTMPGERRRWPGRDRAALCAEMSAVPEGRSDIGDNEPRPDRQTCRIALRRVTARGSRAVEPAADPNDTVGRTLVHLCRLLAAELLAEDVLISIHPGQTDFWIP